MKLLYILSSILIFSISSSFGQTSPDLSKLSKKQVEIMDSLNAYIDIIINKEAPYEVVMPARNKAESLFNPEALIEVSIPGQSEIRKFRSGKYLARIQLLKYEEVNITAIEFDKKDKIISANVVQVTKP